MILFEHTVPAGAIVVTVIGALALAGYWFWRFLHVNATSIVLAILRAAFLLLLGWCLLRPMWKATAVTALRPRFLVLLDSSRSMGLSNRWETAQQIRALPWAKKLGAQAEIETLTFDRELTPARDGVKPEGTGSLVREGLKRVVERYRGQPLGGILLLSDGLDTREENNDWARAPWPCPIYSVRLEPPSAWEEQVDVRVQRLETPRRVVAGWDSKLTAVIAGQGTKGQAINVQLLENGALLQELPTQLPEGGGVREVSFPLQHPAVGNFIYTVTVPPLAGEAVTNDNTAAVSVQVVDTKNRLLYLEGLPRMESKFLTRALLANRTVTPLVFLQGADGKFFTVGQRGGMTTDLTTEQLTQFKIVMLGDLAGESLGAERATALVKFVEEGGSLVLLGGPTAWGDRGFLATPLAKLLPATQPGRPREGKLAVTLTDEGRSHPVLASLTDLPPVLSVFDSGNVVAGAQVLIAAGGAPLVVAQRFGQGKVVAVLTDSLWRWQLEPRTDAPYQRFWSQLVEWLTPKEDTREEQELDLFADTDQPLLGEPVALRARFGGKAVTATVHCDIRTVEERTLSFPMPAQTVTTSDGKSFPGFGVEFTAQNPGAHTAVAVAEVGGKKIESAPFTFFVRPFTPELAPRPSNVELLKALAEVSSGKFCEPPEINAILSALSFKATEEQRVTHRTLWNTWPMLACLVGLLTVEWVVRKAKNLP